MASSASSVFMTDLGELPGCGEISEEDIARLVLDFGPRK
jgi:hypothetical protein